MNRITIRRWAFVHKWTSLISAAFVLVVCITGLPLIFRDEIHEAFDPQPARKYARLPADAPAVSLDRVVADARALHPHRIVTSVFVDDDEPQTIVFLAPSWKALKADRRAQDIVRFDRRTGAVLPDNRRARQQGRTMIDALDEVVFRLHTDLFAGLAGDLFMGAMGLLLVIAVVSGVVLYGPLTRKLDFGAVRTDRSRRIRWLDLHNLLGVVTLAWALVVGTTGVINELATPLVALWQRTDVRSMLTPYAGQAPVEQSELLSVQDALDTARRALLGMVVIAVAFPGSEDATPFHYAFWAHGDTPLTKRLLSPVLVDARTGKLTAVVSMPWYLRALEISRPLHFGDYGGPPLKILWALLDVVTIMVLGSGIYLWLGRRKSVAPVAA